MLFSHYRAVVYNNYNSIEKGVIMKTFLNFAELFHLDIKTYILKEH